MPKHKLKPHKTPRPNKRDLLRYRKFAEAFLAFGSPTFQSATASAIKAGYTEAYAKSYGYKLCDRLGVQKEMERIRDLRLKRSTIASPEEVLETLTQQMRMLPNELMADGALIHLDKMTRDQAHAVAGMKETRRTIPAGEGVITETKLEYKLVDRQKAADMLARHHGMYERDNEQQKPEAPQHLVAFPVGPISLEAWQEAAVAIIKAQKEAEASRP